MNIRFASIAARATSTVTLSLSSLAASAAVIVPTGGTLTLHAYGPEQPEVTQIASLYGDFQVTNTAVASNGPTVTAAQVDGGYSIDSLSLIATAHSFGGGNGIIYGTLGFDLTEDTALAFSFGEVGAWPFQGGHWLTIRDEQGQVELGCTLGGTQVLRYGGCAVGRQAYPQPVDVLPNEGTLLLQAGHYDVSFDLRATAWDYRFYDSAFAFNLSVVPLPGALPLLLSGLGLLGMAGVRRGHGDRARSP